MYQPTIKIFNCLLFKIYEHHTYILSKNIFWFYLLLKKIIPVHTEFLTNKIEIVQYSSLIIIKIIISIMTTSHKQQEK